MKMRAILGLPALIIGSALHAQPAASELTERLNAPVVASFTSPKQPVDMELCMASAMTRVGVPTAFREGEDRVHVVGWMISLGNRVAIASVSMTRDGDRTRVDIRVRGRGFDDRISADVRACL